jgi:acetyltransferase-like isoleucine patch superfamily enzyme
MLKFVKRVLDFIHFQESKNAIKKFRKYGKGTSVNYPIDIEYPENLILEDYVHLGPNSWFSCYNLVTIGRGTIIGPRIKVYTGNHNYDSDLSIPYDNITLAKKVTIGENVWIGGDVIILPGVEIGEGSIIAGGSVVTKSFEAGSIIGGNPAKVIKSRDMDKYYALKSEDKIYLKLKGESFFSPEIHCI